MAIIEVLPGVEITITAGGAALKEYLDQDTTDNSKTITRYVEAETDQNFSVSIKVNPETRFKAGLLCFEVFIDGNAISSSLVRKKWCKSTAYNLKIDGVPLPRRKVRNFHFADLKTGESYLCPPLHWRLTDVVEDGPTPKKRTSKMKELGSIKITAQYMQSKGRAKGGKSDRSNKELESIGQVSEREIKGQTISHTTGYSIPRIPATTMLTASQIRCRQQERWPEWRNHQHGAHWQA